MSGWAGGGMTGWTPACMAGWLAGGWPDGVATHIGQVMVSVGQEGGWVDGQVQRWVGSGTRE